MLNIQLDKIPDDMKRLKQWVCYKLEEVADESGEKRLTKIPHNPNGGARARANDPSTWNTFEFAVQALQRHPNRYDGIEFIISKYDPFTVIDLDHCVKPDGTIERWAQEILNEIDSYAEFSQSGRGIHIIVKANKPGPRCRTAQFPGFEIYDGMGGDEEHTRHRPFVCTGNIVPGNIGIIQPAPNEIRVIYNRIFNPELDKLDRTYEQSSEPVKESSSAGAGSLSDFDLIEKATNAKNGSGARFAALYAGDISCYIGADGKPDESAADIALCNMLAFWTNKNPEQIDRLFRQSGLYRDKWERTDYRDRTIAKAIADTRDTYQSIPSGRSSSGQIRHGSKVQQSDKEKKVSQATLILNLALDLVKYWFQTPEGETYVRIPINECMQTHAIHSTEFRAHLRHTFYTRYGELPRQENLKNVIDQIDAEARTSGNIQPVHIRLASHNGAIYLDLGNSKWESVEITSNGWNVIQNSPIAFRRGPGTLPLPKPESGGSLSLLREFVNLSDDQWVLFAAFLLGAMQADGPFPVLALSGEQGSAKSTVTRIIKELIDPNSVPLKIQPREDREVLITAHNNWLIAYDNLSRVPDWLSDVFAALATGVGYSTRELYTNKSESIMAAKRPLVINGITDLIDRSDLLDRAILVVLDPIPEENRMPANDFWADFEQIRPMILGSLLDGLSAALKNRYNVQLDKLPRMADFAIWVVAAEEMMPWEPGTFMDTYADNRESAIFLALEGNPVAEYFLEFVKSNPAWNGLVSDLYKLLRPDNPPDKFPKDSTRLGAAIRRIAPNLRRLGIDVQIRHTKSGSRIIINAGDATASLGDAEIGEGDAQLSLGDAGDANFPHVMYPPKVKKKDNQDIEETVKDDHDTRGKTASPESPASPGDSDSESGIESESDSENWWID